jgi:hypothetical protein
VRLTGLRVGGDPAAWEALGFAVQDGVVTIGGVAVEIAGEGGLRGWHVDGLASDVLPSVPAAPAGEGRHPNGVVGVDHVVAFTPDFDGTVEALAADGLAARRVRDAGGGVRQAFYVLETSLLELAGPVEGELRFWGVTLVVDDLDALADRLGDRLGEVKDALQPGRRIATLRREAGLTLPVAFMTPR